LISRVWNIACIRSLSRRRLRRRICTQRWEAGLLKIRSESNY
jgi:hypothetical protein